MSKICPICGYIMSYDSYFKDDVCRQCGNMKRIETKVVWVLEYDFHLYDIYFAEKEVIKKTCYFDKPEELIATFRKKKDALFANSINYNDNFKLYRAVCEEMDSNMIETLL